MNKNVIDLAYGQTILSKERKEHILKSEKINRILSEAYGSFPGQYNACIKIADEIVLKAEKQEYISDKNCNIIIVNGEIPNIGDIKIITKWYVSKYGDTIVRGLKTTDEYPTIELTVYAGEITYYNLSSTIAHEIMHCFQQTLPKMKGVNDWSMLLYQHLLEFYNNAPSFLTSNFFYGLYICYAIETSANISSVSAYIKGRFKDKDKNTITTGHLQAALKKYEKYSDYVDVYSSLKDKNFFDFTDKDIEYITKCMTKPITNQLSNKSEALFSKEDFNVRKFIETNMKKIITISKDTIDKMWKNIMIYIEEN